MNNGALSFGDKLHMIKLCTDNVLRTMYLCIGPQISMRGQDPEAPVQFIFIAGSPLERIFPRFFGRPLTTIKSGIKLHRSDRDF